MRRLLLLLPCLLAWCAPAHAYYVSNDRGGLIGQYLQDYATIRDSGQSVIIDGQCLSACTLVLGIIPRERIVVTPRARFGFHAAWMPDDDGRPVTSKEGTQALWSVYPRTVRRWISAHGGLTRRMIYLSAAAYQHLYHHPMHAKTRKAAHRTKHHRAVVARATQ